MLGERDLLENVLLSAKRSSRIVSGVIASKAKQSRLRDCVGGLARIASLSLAMTVESGSMQKQYVLAVMARLVVQPGQDDLGFAEFSSVSRSR
jgi:hypothetical protein